MNIRIPRAALLLAVLLPLSLSVSAQTPIDHPVLKEDTSPDPRLLICWYDSNKALEGADTAQPGARPGLIKGKPGELHAWGYAIKADGASACPKKLPTKP